MKYLPSIFKKKARPDSEDVSPEHEPAVADELLQAIPGLTPLKHKIHYHRAYRKLEQQSTRHIAFAILFMIVLPDILIVTFFSKLTHLISSISRYILSFSIPEDLVLILSKPYVYDNVYILTVPGRFPTLTLSIIVAVASLLFMFLAATIKQVVDPKLVWLFFISFINLVSALFFIFFADYFPYDVEVFSEMYIKTELGIWLIIPFILTFSFIPLSTSLFKKFIAVIMAILYSMVFACIRYIVFLYLLHNITHLFMALMFLMLGPFLDFVYIVGVYSLFLYKIGKNKKKDLEIWHWLY